MTQDEAYDILSMGYNAFLTGAAGTGKTHLINRFIRHAHTHGISIAITASTGIAATHVGGMTIHSWSGIGVKDNLSDHDIELILAKEYLTKRLVKTQILIIDEVSMLSGDFLASLNRLLQRARVSPEPFGGIQVVFVGDFFQLPPVSRTQVAEYAFEHPEWRTWKLAICVLTKQYRQLTHEDKGADPLLDILTQMREGWVSEEVCALLDSRNICVETEDHTELFTKNIAVDTYNQDRLDAIGGDILVYEMRSKGAEKLVESLKKGCLAPETLVLKKGARVMFVKNNFDAGYVNGSIGHVTGQFEGLPIVELLDGTQVIADYQGWMIEENGNTKAEITQIPLRLAWAITVHKSQGMTLDTAVIDLSDAFVFGQGYVALSRVRSLQGLILRGYNATALRIDERVIEYDRVLCATSDRTAERLTEISAEEKQQKVGEAIMRLGGVKDPIPDAIVDGRKVSSDRKKSLAHEETKIYLKNGRSVDDIAEIRGVKPSTIVSHIEKILEEDPDFDISFLRPEDDEGLLCILDAFDQCATTSLSPIREYLIEVHGGSWGYDEVRFARLFISKK